jgi:hypothetical protein
MKADPTGWPAEQRRAEAGWRSPAERRRNPALEPGRFCNTCAHKRTTERGGVKCAVIGAATKPRALCKRWTFGGGR